MKGSNNWQQNYLQWIQKVGENAMQGSQGGTGPSMTPPGMVGQQYSGRPQDFSQQGPNALMAGSYPQMPMQGMQQGIPQDLQNNAIYTDTMRMLRG